MKFKFKKANDELDKVLLWLAAFSLIAMLVNGFHSEFYFVMFVSFWIVRGVSKKMQKIYCLAIPILFVFATIFDPLILGYSIETFAKVNGWVMCGAVIGIILGLDFKVKKKWRYKYEP